MANPFSKIALALSGGGFRSASFQMGTMSYLHHVDMLKNVEILSTVSGGTFSGMAYALALSKGESFISCYKHLNKSMIEAPLLKEAVEKLSSGKMNEPQKNANLINAFSEVYHDRFFSQAYFKTFWDSPPKHLKYLVFNSTEFAYGLYFRFRYYDNKVNSGNYYLNVAVAAAKEMRISDIVAASSCFPAGFEPITFPHDFRASGNKSPMLDELSKDQPFCEGVGLMDGGIVDNQGIRSTILAIDHIIDPHNNTESADSEDSLQPILKKENPYLFIISDVASHFMTPYRSEEKKTGFIGMLSLRSIKWITGILSALTVSIIFITLFNINTTHISDSCLGKIYFGFSAFVLAGLALAVAYSWYYLQTKVFNKVPIIKRLSWRLFNKLSINTYEWLITNRAKSVVTMVSDVFLKQVRRLMYEQVYSSPFFAKKRISNLITDLLSQQVTGRLAEWDSLKNRIEPEYQPALLKLYTTPKILQDITQNAFSMGTTLWFDDADKKACRHRDLVVCGQFTMCFNIIEYILRDCMPGMKDDPEVEIILNKALEDWIKFETDPYWMVKKGAEYELDDASCKPEGK